jgi:hypothetical protein
MHHDKANESYLLHIMQSIEIDGEDFELDSSEIHVTESRQAASSGTIHIPTTTLQFEQRVGVPLA